MAFFDKILNVQEQKVRCASSHLVSGVHFKFAHSLLAYKVKPAQLFSVISCSGMRLYNKYEK